MSLPNDKYKPANQTLLGDYDNYQIYDLIVAYIKLESQFEQHTEASTVRRYRNSNIPLDINSDYIPYSSPILSGDEFADETAGSGVLGYDGIYRNFILVGTDEFLPNIYQSILPDNILLRKYCLQRYTLSGQSNTVKIKQLIDSYPWKPPNKVSAKIESYEPELITYYSVRGYRTNPIPGNKIIIKDAADVDADTFNWEYLITNKQFTYSAIATESKIYAYRYWAINPYENHPDIDITLDYREEKVYLRKGRKFTIKLDFPIAETLEFPAELLLYTYNLSNAYNLNDLVGSGYRNSLTITPAINGITQPSKNTLNRGGWEKSLIRNYFVFGGGVYNDNYSVPEVVNGEYFSEKTFYNYTFLKYESLLANNGNWQSVPSVATRLYPDVSDYSRIAVATPFLYHYSNQPDNNIGTLVMDSPVIREIYAMLRTVVEALESEKYSTNDIDANEPRVTTLGYLIENTARITGLRLNASGKIDTKIEKKYLPKTLNNPSNPNDSNYGLTSFGQLGRFLPHLPTTYNEQGREEILHDVVADIPQMLEAVLRQLDKALGIQHGSEIRTRGLDGKVQSYPNQLALLLHLANKIESIDYYGVKTFNQNLVMGAELRGLYSGIGIPVTQQFLNLKANDNKAYQLPYYSHQKNKPSIATGLTDIKVNLGIINGVLMPKKQAKGSLLDPFER